MFDRFVKLVLKELRPLCASCHRISLTGLTQRKYSYYDLQARRFKPTNAGAIKSALAGETVPWGISWISLGKQNEVIKELFSK